MPWFDRLKKREKEEELPESLQGKTAEEVVAALQAAEDSKKRLETLEAERKTEREQVTALNNSFNDVKARLTAAEANKTPPVKEEPADWLTDPDKAMAQHMAPLANLTVNNAAMTARILALQSLDNEDLGSPSDNKKMNGRLFRAWESEINTEANKYPPMSMGQPQAWIGIYYLVKGRHADELANPETRKKKYNFIESGAQGAPPPVAKEKSGVEALTDQEKHVADRMNVSYENYAKRKKGMQFVNA